MLVGIKINAGHDPSGNPQRGWAVVDAESGDLVDFVDEGYQGRAVLKAAYPEASEGPEFHVPKSEYRELKRFAKERSTPRRG
jgi:hypothetical protein